MKAGREHPLKSYSKAEKAAYLSLVALMAAADGVFASEERESLYELCRSVGFREAETAEIISFAEKVIPFTLEETLCALRGSDLRFTLMTDVLFMAYADKKVTEEEEREIERFSSLLDINVKQVCSLRTYVETVLAFGSELECQESCWASVGHEFKNNWGMLGVPVGAVLIAGTLVGSGVAAAVAGLGLGAAGGVAAVLVMGGKKEHWHQFWGRLKTCMQ